MIAGLPYDAEVEWLYRVGTQVSNVVNFPYIDLGIPAGLDVGVDIVAADTYRSNIPSMITGSFIASSSGYWGVYNYQQNNYKMWGVASVAGAHENEVYYRYQLNWQGSRRYDVTKDGISVHSSQLTTTPNFSPSNIWLFAINKGSYYQYETGAGLWIKSARYSVGNNIIRDFIPVRFTNGLGQSEGAMYDRVSRKLFRNAGTGAFTIGPDVAVPVVGLHFMRRPRYTAKDYVQTGLVAMWDGIENAGLGVHDPNATSWLDLIGSKQMPATLSSLSWSADALVRTGVDGLTYDTGLDFSDPLSERTFEFVISYDADYTDTTSNYFIARFDALGTWLSFWNRAKFGISLYAGGGTNETPFEQPSFKGSVSLVGSSTPYAVNPTQRHYAYYYANGTYFRNGAFGGGSSSSAIMELFAAARNWPSSNTVKIHSIRIYSSALTAAEIAHNYAVDKERFNLP